MSKRLGGIIGCKYKTSPWHLNGFLYGSIIGSTVRGANRQKHLPGIGFFFKCVPDLSDGKSVEPMKFREPVPIRTGPHSPKKKGEKKTIIATTVQ